MIRLIQCLYIIFINIYLLFLLAVICPPGFTLLEGHCYSKSQWSAWWEYAEYDCVSMDAHLISINSDAEFNFMKDAVKSVSSDIWVIKNKKGKNQKRVIRLMNFKGWRSILK